MRLDRVGLGDHLAELGDQLGAHADLVQVQRHHRAVEHADDHALAEHGGQDADAHVDRVAADGQLDAAVLGQAALGDVELGHDLDAGEDGLVMLAGDRGHGLLEYAVDAVFDHEAVVEGLEMDV